MHAFDIQLYQENAQKLLEKSVYNSFQINWYSENSHKLPALFCNYLYSNPHRKFCIAHHFVYVCIQDTLQNNYPPTFTFDANKKKSALSFYLISV